MSTNLEKKGGSSGASIFRGHRLKALADAVPADCKRLIDVGCDHGRVPLEVLDQGIAGELLLIDINKEPLERAKTRARTKYPQFSDRIQYLQNNGLEGIGCRPDDVLLISGLGGESIADILVEAFHDRDKTRPSRLILQPQTKHYELRTVLQELSFCLSEERLVLDENRFYTIIICAGDTDEATKLNELELYIGPGLLRAVSESLSRKEISETDKLYFEWAEKQAKGLEREGRGDAGRAVMAEEWAELLEKSKR